MNDVIKWMLRTGATAVIWIFLLSININGRSVFSYANEILVQNAFIEMLDRELEELWSKVYTTASSTFSEESDRRETF